MKETFCFFTLVILVLSSGCKKELNSSTNNNSNANIDSVITYLKSEIPCEIRKLDLESIKSFNYKDKSFAVEIFEKSSFKKFLLLKKLANSYTGNWVDLSNLSKSKSKYYQGYITLRGINVDFTKKLVVDKNKIVEINSQEKNKLNSLRVYPQQQRLTINKEFSDNKLLKQTLEEIELPEIVVVAEGDAPDYFNLDWLFGGDQDYNDLYIQSTNWGNENSGSAGGGGAGASNNQNIDLTALAIINRPKNPIKNLKDELKCFTVNSSSSYTISVNVNQADPNTRDKIDPSSDFIVGHTFLTL